jgi:hypothetical protein
MIISLPLGIITWGLVLIWLFDFGDKGILYRIMDRINNHIRLSILWGIIMFVFLTAFFIQLGRGQYQDAMLKQIDSIIQVDGNKVMINKLPENYYYKDLKGNRIGYDEDILNGKEKQVLVFEEDKTYNVSYLIDKYGRKYELSDEDEKFLKERGVK